MTKTEDSILNRNRKSLVPSIFLYLVMMAGSEGSRCGVRYDKFRDTCRPWRRVVNYKNNFVFYPEMKGGAAIPIDDTLINALR